MKSKRVYYTLVIICFMIESAILISTNLRSKSRSYFTKRGLSNDFSHVAESLVSNHRINFIFK